MAFMQPNPKPIACFVELSRALRYAGHKSGRLPDDLENLLVVSARTCEEVSSPKFVSKCFEIRHDAHTGCIDLEGSSLVLKGEYIAQHLAGCTKVVLMAVTLGMGNERALKQAQAVSPLEGLLLDACSSSLVEEAACVVSKEIERCAREADLQATKRFSPGYGDLSLDIQPELLRALQADGLLGIHVGSSMLMTPTKSITAIIGLKPFEEVNADVNRSSGDVSKEPEMQESSSSDALTTTEG